MENGANRTHYRLYIPWCHIAFGIFSVSKTEGFVDEE